MTTIYSILPSAAPFTPTFTPPVESTATLLAVIESMRRDRRLDMAQAEVALARLAHAQQAITWHVIDADIDAARVALEAIRVRNSADGVEAKTWEDEG